MLAISGLATSCQPISAVIEAGLEVVSEAKPTATAHTTPVESSEKAEAVEDQRAVGRRQIGGEGEAAQQHERIAGEDHRPAHGQRRGHPRCEEREARAARDDEVAEDPGRGVPGAGLDADQHRGEGAEEQASRRTPSVKPEVPPAGPY